MEKNNTEITMESLNDEQMEEITDGWGGPEPSFRSYKCRVCGQLYVRDLGARYSYQFPKCGGVLCPSKEAVVDN